MKLLDYFFGRKAAELTYDQIIGRIDGELLGSGLAGVHVSEKMALQISTVLACVKVISEGCSTPDLHVFRDNTKTGKQERATNIPEYRLLSRRPNEWQTSLEWRKMMTIHACLAGKGLSIINRAPNGRVQELIPVEPGTWTEERISRYELRYTVRDEWGIVGVFSPDEVFQVNALQWAWYKTLPAVQLAASAIGLAMSAERAQQAMHNNSMKPSGVYSVDGNLTQEQHDRLSTWIKKRVGLARLGEPLVLDRAAKWVSTAMTNVDAQHVETRRLQIEEICRVFGVFPIMIGHSDKSATFASSEAFFSAHLIHTLMPWHKAWTQRLDETLLDGSGPLYAKFDTRYMRMGAIKDRALWSRTMAEMGIYTRNELREEEGKDPLPGLDEPLTPMNMANGSPKQGTTNENTTDPGAQA